MFIHLSEYVCYFRPLDQNSPPTTGLSPPYSHHALLGKYEDDFPLRKTGMCWAPVVTVVCVVLVSCMVVLELTVVIGKHNGLLVDRITDS